jgi:nucleotide-binding universal stress UspA family protein
MYKRILVAIENSAADRTILAHVEQLARLTGAQLLLVHIADGWAARAFNELNLRESEEMLADRAYLDGLRADLESRGFVVETVLGTGDPAREICRLAEIHGQTANHVRHRVKMPVLLLKAQSS